VAEIVFVMVRRELLAKICDPMNALNLAAVSRTAPGFATYNLAHVLCTQPALILA
jgi:hypothetical protein